MKGPLEKKVYTCKFPDYQVISHGFKILDLDLYTVKVEDLDFVKDYELTISRGSYGTIFSGIVSWFEVEFPTPYGEEIIILSTSPHS